MSISDKTLHDLKRIVEDKKKLEENCKKLFDDIDKAFNDLMKEAEKHGMGVGSDPESDSETAGSCDRADQA